MVSLFLQREEETFVLVCPGGNSETDETGQQTDDLVAGQARMPYRLIECYGGMFAEGGQQMGLVVAVVHQGALARRLLPPDVEMYGRCQDVLVVDADIGATLAFGGQGEDGLLGRWRYGGNHHVAALGMQGVEMDGGLGLAILVGGGVHHVDFLFGADARDVAVVAHADEQPSAVGIGKGRDGAGQFLGVHHLVFEVLLLVLALCYQLLQVLPVA